MNEDIKSNIDQLNAITAEINLEIANKKREQQKSNGSFLSGLFTLYALISIVLLIVRGITGNCNKIYLNYAFPISVLHCEIK